LDAAHYLIINTKGDLKIERYWDIDRDGKKYQGSVEEASGVFYSLLRDSIKLRLRSDVPVGSSLSGGLDSSSIVMLIDNLKGNELKQNTFSARFKDFKKDEGEHIETVVRACKNVSVHYTWPDSEYFEKVFDKVTYFQDEPYGSASIVAQYAVMEIAKEHNVTVLLDGQGADEQLAGYMPYYQLYLNQLFYDSKSKFNNEYNAYINYHNEQYPYKRIDDTETFRMKAGRYRRKLLHQQMPYHDALTNALYNSTINCGLKELLRYADRNSMAHSREVRLPFLSHKLVEFVFSLPDHFKINQGWTKYVLRKSMETTLPNSICWRIDKIGYEPPQSNWLKNAQYTSEIKRVSKLLQIESNENSNSIFNQEWRLLMASRFI
jgi:asparagine synthase (glutamine-hydrolysing)